MNSINVSGAPFTTRGSVSWADQSDQCVKLSPVDTAISDNNSAVRDIEDMISSLESTLAPILTPESSNKSGEVPRPVGESPLVDTLKGLGERQRRAAGRLQSLLSRVTV